MLNPNQRAAVETSLKRVFVLSGAGTGKTTVIYNRIRHLLTNNVPSCSILFISFTTRTVNDIKIKFVSSRDNPVIKTFHGLAYNEVLHSKSKRLVNTQSELFDHFDTDILKQILAEKELFTVKKTTTKRLTEYQQILDENHLFDYVDLETSFLKQLQDVTYQNHIQSRFQYLFIDEAQDMSNIQVEIIAKLVNFNTYLFFVGDPDQSIYGFRGSIPNQVNRLIKRFCCHLYQLVLCYRCNSIILQHANYLIEHNKHRVKKVLIPHRSEPGVVEYHQFSNTKNESDFVLSKLREIVATKINQKHIAVLFRNHVMGNEIKMALSKSYLQDVACLSIHQAKGLEFEAVIFMGVQNPRVVKKQTIEEERRLFFVAMTRAKNILILTSPNLNERPKFIKEAGLFITKH